MEARREGEFSEDELAYLNSGGQIPPPETEAPASEPEAAPEVEAQPEPVAEASEDPDVDVIEADDETHKGRKVGYSAYLRKKAEADAARKERDEHRQQLEATRREMAVQNARIEERFRQWQAHQQAAAQQAQTQPQPPAAPPALEEDPLGTVRWQGDRIAQLEQQVNQSAQERHQAARIAQLDAIYRNDNLQAQREVPEYTDAYTYLVNRAEQIIKLQNRGWSDIQVRAEAERQERMLAATAIQQGIRPAAMIMQTAAVYGWAPKAQAAAQTAPAQPDAAAQQAKLDAISQGQAQNRSLSAAGRPGGNTATMTLERFMSLSDDEAREWNAKNPGGLERLSGGR